MIDDIVELVAVRMHKNKYGVDEKHEIKRPVYAKIKSVSQTEFFKAAQTDLNADFVFCIFVGDYNGEEMVGYKGKTHRVYRVYYNGDTVELYAESRVGNGTERN